MKSSTTSSGRRRVCVGVEVEEMYTLGGRAPAFFLKTVDFFEFLVTITIILTCPLSDFFGKIGGGGGKMKVIFCFSHLPLILEFHDFCVEKRGSKWRGRRNYGNRSDHLHEKL